MSKDVGVGNNGAKAWATWEYSPTHLKTKLWRRHLWAKGSCWEEALSSNLALKLGPIKKIPLASFSSHLLKNVWVRSTFP